MLVVRAPTRLDFGGGWTDVPPYPEERGGFVCNVAINRFATVTIGGAGEFSSPALASAALGRSGLGSYSARIESDFPIGAGLGGSSAAGVAMAAAIARLRGTPRTPAELAEWSRVVEVEDLGIAGGRQDHYAAAFGGALGIAFGESVTVERIGLTTDAAARLERRCILAFTGESRISAATITAVLDGYATRDRLIVNALQRMKALAYGMRDALLAGDIDGLAALVGEHWTHQRSLHAGISTARIDALEAVARAAGAQGMKALGASGGGCVIVFAPDDKVDAVSRAIAPFADVMPWRVSPGGVVVLESTSD